MKKVGLILLALLIALSPSIGKGEERIRVAILPWELHAHENLEYLREALYDLISSRIGVDERIEVIGKARVERAIQDLKGKKVTNSDILRLGRTMGVDYLIYGSLNIVGGAVSIDVKVGDIKAGDFIFSTSQGKDLGSLIPMVGKIALDVTDRMLRRRGYTPMVKGFGGAPIYAEKEGTNKEDDFIVVLKGTKETERVWRSRTFSRVFREAALGDVDGDGKTEIALIDDHNLWIYRRTGDTLDLVWKERGVLTDEHLYVDVADINGNGISEIYVTRMMGGRLDSYVLEYRGKGFAKIASHIPLFLRVIRDENGTPILAGQGGDGEEGFRGKVFKLTWQGETLSKGEALDLPKGVNIFGFTYGNIGGSRGVIQLDERDHLAVYIKEREWRRVWRSKDYFGGTINTMEVGLNPDETRLEDIKGRVLFMDLDGDGVGEVIVNRNFSTLTRYVKGFKSYEKGEVVDLEWDGKGLEESWKTKTLNAYVGSPLIGDFDNDGGKDLVLLLVEGAGTLSRSASTTILSYNLIAR